MNALPVALGSAFDLAALELGMASAAQLFIRELSDEGGRALLSSALAELGAHYPVFACLVRKHLAGEVVTVDGALVAEALGDVHRLLIVGHEADAFDALLPHLGDVEVGLLTHAGSVEPAWSRVLANYGGRVAPVSLGDLTAWGGARSALMTFVYGASLTRAHVPAAWLRVHGPDVRTLFRSLVGWDILGAPMVDYPQWLLETDVADFSLLVGP